MAGIVAFPPHVSFKKTSSETPGERKGEKLWKRVPTQPCHLPGVPCLPVSLEGPC